jgi:hypothetical protein
MRSLGHASWLTQLAPLGSLIATIRAGDGRQHSACFLLAASISNLSVPRSPLPFRSCTTFSFSFVQPVTQMLFRVQFIPLTQPTNFPTNQRFHEEMFQPLTVICEQKYANPGGMARGDFR